MNSYFKNSIAVLSLFALSLTACAPKTITANPPTAPTSPNIGIVLLLEGLTAGCQVAAVDVDPAVATWLNGPCPTAAAGLLNTIEANGSAAKVQAIFTTLKNEAATIPASASGLKYVTQGLDLAQDVLNTYLQITGQTTPPSVAPVGASQFVPAAKPTKIKWSSADKAKLAALKAKLASKNK